jgi:hypothetical protein
MRKPRSASEVAIAPELGADHMPPDEPFPLDLFSSRVRNAILDEFAGRCPSVREVDAIDDKHWLSTPGIGATVLKKLRELSQDVAPPACEMMNADRLTDAELLKRLAALQEEVKVIKSTVQVRAAHGSGRVSPLLTRLRFALLAPFPMADQLLHEAVQLLA